MTPIGSGYLSAALKDEESPGSLLEPGAVLLGVAIFARFVPLGDQIVSGAVLANGVFHLVDAVAGWIMEFFGILVENVVPRYRSALWRFLL